MAMLALTMDLARRLDPADVGDLVGDTQLDRPGAGVSHGDRRRTRRDGPVALSALFDERCELVPASPDRHAPVQLSAAAPVSDAVLYSGNRHEACRACSRPAPERRWNAMPGRCIRLQLQSDGVTAFPDLRPAPAYLTSMPGMQRRPRIETVARA